MYAPICDGVAGIRTSCRLTYSRKASTYWRRSSSSCISVACVWCRAVRLQIPYISPRLKKDDLDSADAKSYRPISDLAVLSKPLERLAARQLVEHLATSKLLPTLHSDYRAHYSTETAVLRVLADILRAVDSGDLALLTLLDLSADTVDHARLLCRLEVS